MSWTSLLGKDLVIAPQNSNLKILHKNFVQKGVFKQLSVKRIGWSWLNPWTLNDITKIVWTILGATGMNVLSECAGVVGSCDLPGNPCIDLRMAQWHQAGGLQPINLR